jgi:uncharacterized repeat protein (TIGR02543 family)
MVMMMAAATAAQTYVVTASGTGFTATRSGAAVGEPGAAIQTVVNAIRADAAGAAVTIQFGSGGSDNLNIGTAGISFANVTGETWGSPVTLTGGLVTASTNVSADNTITVGTGISIAVAGRIAAMNNTHAIGTTGSNYSITVVEGGDITVAVAGWNAIRNGTSITSSGSVRISGGRVSATGTNTAIYNLRTLTITGGTVSSESGRAIENSNILTISETALVTSGNTAINNGTIFNQSSTADAISITGGTVENTAAGGIAIFNSATNSNTATSRNGRLNLSGNPTITGYITGFNAGNIEVPFVSSLTGSNVYTLDPVLGARTDGAIMVRGGSGHLDKFRLNGRIYELTGSGDNIILSLKDNHETFTPVYVITNNGADFNVARSDSTVRTGVTIQAAIEAIRRDAAAEPCIIQFGSGGSNTLNLGTSGITFANTTVTNGEAWGSPVTITGGLVTASTNVSADNTITVGTGISIAVAGRIAAMNNTHAIGVASGGSITVVEGGDVTATGTSQNAIRNGTSGTSSGSVRISGGRVFVPGTNSAIFNTGGSNATVTITGGTVSSERGRAIEIAGGRVTISETALVTSGNTTINNGTIFNQSGATDAISITGGTIENTAGGIAIFNSVTNSNTAANRNGRLNLSGNPTITGHITGFNAGNIEVPFVSSLTGSNVYTLDPVLGARTDGAIMVRGGSGHLDKFRLNGRIYELTGSGDNIILSLKDNHETFTPVYIITNNGADFNVVRSDSTVRTGVTIQAAIEAIRRDAAAEPCIIQFGSGGSNILNLGTSGITFANTTVTNGEAWGSPVTLTGGIVTASTNVSAANTINVSTGISIAVAGRIAAMNNTHAIGTTDAAGTAGRDYSITVVEGGDITVAVAGWNAIRNSPATNASGSVIVSGGRVFVPGTNSAIYNTGSNATVTITGGTVSSERGRAIEIAGGRVTISETALVTSGNTAINNGTIFNQSSATDAISITGGTIENTAGGIAIFNSYTNSNTAANRNGRLNLSGNPTITGRISSFDAGNIEVPFVSPLTGNNVYALDPPTRAQTDGAIMVRGGGAHLPRFSLQTLPNHALATSGDNIVLVAGATHTVGFDRNGGTGGNIPEALYVAPNGTIPVSSRPSSAGVTMAGHAHDDIWYIRTGTAPNFTYTEFVFGTTPVTSDITLSLRWTAAVTHTVTFDRNGGVGGTIPAPLDVVAGQSIPVSSQPSLAGITRDGYAHDGAWYTRVGTAPNFVYTEFVFGTTVVNASITLYVKWEPAAYSITYELDGGTAAVANPVTYTIETPAFTLSNPTKTGYTFAGWTGSNGTTPQIIVTVALGSTGDLAYTANWTSGTPDTYTVTWSAGGGLPAPTQTSVDHGGVITAPAAMTRAGYTFDGWYSDPEFTSAVTFPLTNVTSAAALYAKWTAVVVVIPVLGGVEFLVPADTMYAGPGASHNVRVRVLDTLGAPFTESAVGLTFTVNISGYSINKVIMTDASGVAVFGLVLASGVSGGVVNFTVSVDTGSGVISASSALRVIPPSVENNAPEAEAEEFALPQPAEPLGKFTAGPNVIRRGSSPSVVRIFREGGRVADAALTVYDASGNIVSRIAINDGHRMGRPASSPASAAESWRAVGSWDLTDARGRPVGAGMYLFKGEVTTVDGRREKVSFKIGVR